LTKLGQLDYDTRMPKRALIIGLFGVLALSGAFFVFWERGQKLGMPTNDQATSLKNEQSI